MDSIPATPLNVAAVRGGHGARQAADPKDGDNGSFEEALGNELAAINPHPKSATGELVSASDAPADSDKTAASEETDVLKAILDATAAASPVGVPVTAIPIEQRTGVKHTDTTLPRVAASRDVRAAVTARSAEAAGEAAMTAPAAESAGETAVAQSKDEAAPRAAIPSDFKVPTGEENAPQAKVAVAMALPAPVSPVSPSGSRIIATEAPQPRTSTSAPKPSPAISESSPAEAAETREGAAAKPGHELFLARSETTPERTHSEAVPAPVMEKLPTADSAPSATTVTQSLEALSSAALASKWTAGPQSNSASGAHASASARIDTPIGTDGWGNAFSQKVVWLVDRQQQSAELHVNPPHLGPVDVVLNLTDDGARVAFCSPHAAVRDAIEASLADLRNALAERGLSLGQALVSADPGTAREQLQGDNSRTQQRSSVDVGDSGVVTETQLLRPVRRGLVDIFA